MYFEAALSERPRTIRDRPYEAFIHGGAACRMMIQSIYAVSILQSVQEVLLIYEYFTPIHGNCVNAHFFLRNAITLDIADTTCLRQMTRHTSATAMIP